MESNTPDNCASIARNKRKSALRDKGINYSRSKKQPPSSMVSQKEKTTIMQMSRSPLSQIPLNILSQRDQCFFSGNRNEASTSTVHTQPSSIHDYRRKKRFINQNSVGINLMNRYDNLYEDEPSTIMPNDDMENLLPYSSTQGYSYQSCDVNNEDDEIFEIAMEGYSDIGDPIMQCQHCGACMWYQERKRKHRNATTPKFELCCGDGRVQLPLLESPPPFLHHLLFDIKEKDSLNYQDNIRLYNMMFAFTSFGAKIDRSMNSGRGPPTIRIQGQPCHRIGSMLPLPGQFPKFAQLYIYDTEHEIQNRMEGIRNNKVDPEVVVQLSKMLDENNVHAKSFRMASERLKDGVVQNLKLKLIAERNSDGRINNLPTVSEVAALVVGDIESTCQRDIIMETQSGQLKRIDELHASYLAFQYPLLFPYGEDGYRHDVCHRVRVDSHNRKRNRVTVREWMSFRLQSRKNEAQTLFRSRRLFHQFLVDGYIMVESERLSFIKRNQKKLRVDKYRNLSESQPTEQSQASNIGKRVILPSTFVGSRRYMDQLYFDGMAICGSVGFPDLFLTMTCNPNWPEIIRLLKPMGLKPHDRPDIISRVFKMKFEELLQDLKKRHILDMYTIEFQKRGLPHAHLLIFLHPSNKYPTPDDIDRIICAEIPNQSDHPELHNLVKSHMIHGPCGSCNISSPCMVDGKCSRYFPKQFQQTTVVDQDGYPVYRRRDNGNYVEKNGISLDNRYVVPYNPHLLMKYQAHINMEWCNQSTSIKYLFKYINKGYDRITAVIESSPNGVHNQANLDEVKQYLDCRYVSPSEACWRIFRFPIHGRQPAVERLSFHLQGEQPIYFNDNEDIDNILSRPTVSESMFTSWMEANEKYEEGRTLSYAQYVSKFVYLKRNRCWKPRKSGYTIGRLIWVPPCTGELYYLRMMLTVVKGPRSYEDIRTISENQYPTFRDACFAMGLLKDDREYIDAIREAKDWGSGFYLRKLFVTMLLSTSVNKPDQVWAETWQWLSDGILHSQRIISNNQGLVLSDEQLQNLTLLEIEKVLQRNRRSLKDYPPMPYPNGYITSQLGNRLIYEELNYDTIELKEKFNLIYQSLTEEQSKIFHTIIQAVNHQHGRMFFLYGYGGTGKTHMWKTLTYALRAQKQIVLTVASSGIASLLLPGGRTAHSKFKIPVPSLENSTCNIHQGSELADLLKQTKLIIWDEAPMTHKFCFEALDRSLADIMGTTSNDSILFGGKVVVFGGDFRQILPVIPRGCRSDIVHATINSSYLWHQCRILTLSKNMRLQNSDNTMEIKEFSEWILNVGDGKLSEPNDGCVEIDIPEELLILDFDNPIDAIVCSTYPNIQHHYKDEHYLQTKAILASTIDIVDQINEYVLSIIPGEEKEYLSSDSVDMSDANEIEVANILTPEFLNSLSTSGLPNHKIKLKVGTPIMLLRNLDQTEGLCNGTRLMVTKMANHVLESRIISGKNIGHIIYIPRMSMSPSQSPWPFKLIRRQFPIIVSYAMTINKSQGQSLQSVGLYLPKPVFSHGQLYVAMSRVQTKNGLKILIHDKDGKPLKSTTNVVYKEVFQNL
ncbi:hypothetical protein Lal_00038076 [Lupinus albus]|nr:hypothetical protein Lal_00038076 [Lupinus albus]